MAWPIRSRRASKSTDANDMLYYYHAIEDYNPAPHLVEDHGAAAGDQLGGRLRESARAADDAELIKQVKHGRFILLPITDETRGHGTHSLPAIWGGELVKFLQELK